MLRKLLTIIAAGCQVAAILVLLYSPARAGLIDTRSITISDSKASATDVTYAVQFRTDPTNGWYDIGGIVVDFCAENPIVGNSVCNTPAGFDLNLANLVVTNQNNISGFTISVNSDGNTLIITKNIPDHVGPNAPIHFDLGSIGNNDGVTNPSIANQTYYARALTYGTAPEAESYTSGNPGSYIDAGGFALSTASAMDLSTIVPQFLFFCSAQSIQGYDCATGTVLYVNFGSLGETFTSTGMSQLLVMTNAGSGYGVRTYGTTLTSGNNVINPMALSAASTVGNSQFGMNLVANLNPAVGANPVGPGTAMPAVDYAIPNNFKYVSGDTIISGSGATDWRKFTVSYIVNVSATQATGTYTTTLTFICLANF
jgi:hypothetical protein